MSRVLYRKYRSQTFDEIVGQSHITDILKNAVKSGALAHAYLMVGSRGTGKTSTARILAKAINCTDTGEDGNPCNNCSVCTSITNGSFLDLIEIDAASNRGIDQIRELKERIEFAPSEGKYKVYIIDEVHMLTKEAFNALLKTLEEPPAHVIFILATTDVHKLPATILSRCQRYDFRLGSEDEIRSVLKTTADREGVKLADEALDILVENAHGSYRDSLSLLDVVVSGQMQSDDPSEVTEEEVRRILGIPDTTMVYYLIEKLVSKDVHSALKLIAELESKGVNLQQFSKYVLAMLRDVLVGMATGSISDKEYGFAKVLNERDVLNYINAFLVAERNLRSAHTPALILEMLVVDLATKDMAPMGGASKKPPVKKPAPTTPAVPTAPKEEVDVEPKEDLDDNAEEGGNETIDEEVSVVEEADKEVKPQAVKASVGGTDLTIEEIEEKWENLVNASQKHNGHLFAFLKSAKLVGVDNGTLLLHVPFEFHKDRIEDPKSREAVHASFTEVYGHAIPVRCEVNAAVKRKKKVSADIVLKSIQESQANVKASEANPPKEKAPAGNGEERPKRKLSKQVAAVFEGM